MFYDFYNAAPCSIAFVLPVSNCGFLATQSCEAPHPKYTCPQKVLSGQMIKRHHGLAAQFTNIEQVVHEQENVNVAGLGFGCDEGAKDDKARQITCLSHRCV